MKIMDIARVLREQGITPRRSRDQFFLTDENILDFEIGLAELNKDDIVLEIGAGIGNLTRKIAERCSVVAVEKDKRFLPLLRKIECDVIIGDALAVLEEKRKGKQSFRFNKIISNIPYSLSQKLIIEILQHEWDIAVLCVQREFAEKLWKKEAVAVATNSCCDSDIAKIVPASAFYPAAAESAIIVLKQKSLLDSGFWSFLKTTYQQRNTDVVNVIKNAPAHLAHKKLHQLSAEELKKLWALSKKGGN